MDVIWEAAEDGKFRDGNGVISQFPNGARYEGGFREYRPHGRGILVFPHGHGVMTWPDGTRHEGEWREGKAHGRGVVTYSDGRRYEGEFRDGVRHGSGVMTWPDGERIEGNMRDGQPNGYAIMTKPSGERYEGGVSGREGAWHRDRDMHRWHANPRGVSGWETA